MVIEAVLRTILKVNEDELVLSLTIHLCKGIAAVYEEKREGESIYRDEKRWQGGRDYTNECWSAYANRDYQERSSRAIISRGEQIR